MMTHLEYRINVYHILAAGLKDPCESDILEMQERVTFLQEAFQALQYPITGNLYQNWPVLGGDIRTLRENYRRSFIYPPEQRIMPVESIYRQWTLDPSAEVPFARDKGYLMSDFALHMQALYEQYQLSIPGEYRGLPDHLCLELEFCAFLLENESPARQEQFLREHLNWVDELHRDAVKQAIPEFYRQTIQLTAEFLKCESQSYSPPLAP